jgi:hypothetical protein
MTNTNKLRTTLEPLTSFDFKECVPRTATQLPENAGRLWNSLNKSRRLYLSDDFLKMLLSGIDISYDVINERTASYRTVIALLQNVSTS